MKIEEIVNKFKILGNKKALEGMAKFGIDPKNAYGVSIPNLRKIAKEIGKDHSLSLKLWDIEIHETKILATMIDDPKLVNNEQMENWVNDFYSWDVCDQCCNNLFKKTVYAYEKAFSWSLKEKEFVKRAGFVLIACLAVSDKKAEDKKFEQFFDLIKNQSFDNRNFVKKAVNWALRQIGKKNISLNIGAIRLAEEIQNLDSKAAKWIASNALKELKSNSVQKRLTLNRNK